MNTEVEATNLAASPVEGDQLVDSHEHNPPASDLEKDQSRETESEAPNQPTPSASKGLLDENERSPATEIDKDVIPASATGEEKTSHQSVSLLKISTVNIRDEVSKEFSEMIEHPGNALVAQNDGIEASLSEEQMVAETKWNNAANSSKLSGDLSLCLELIFYQGARYLSKICFYFHH